MKKSTIGGQGVLEGVMMRNVNRNALAVRKVNGGISTKSWEKIPITSKNKFCRLPIIRGLLSFVDMLTMGVGVTIEAAKLYDESFEYEPSKFENFVAKKTGKSLMDVVMVVAVVISLVLSIGLFFVLPNIVTNALRGVIGSNLLMNAIDGVVRILIFFFYILLVAQVKDVKRMFRYHGAEHRTISCYEAELPLTVENVQKQSRLHPRCGTSYMLITMSIAILLFSILGWSTDPLTRVGIRILMLPIVAGVSYEILKVLAKYDNIITRILRWPGMQFQRLTTAPPEDEMAEIAIISFEMALGEKSEEEIDQLIAQFSRETKQEDEEKADSEKDIDGQQDEQEEDKATCATM